MVLTLFLCILSIWSLSLAVMTLSSLFLFCQGLGSLSALLFLQEEYMKLDFSLVSSSLIFSMLVLLISLSVFFWSRFYMSAGTSMVFFVFTLGLFVFSMLVLILSSSLFGVFVGWEGLGVSSFVLIVFYQNWSSYKGGLLTLLTNRLGDGVFMLSSGYWLLKLNLFDLMKGFGLLVIILFVVLSFTKSAQVPFSSWLPAAMAAPTPVSALVHSSTLVTAGVWLMIRYWNISYVNSFLWLFLGFFTLLLSSLAALFEFDTKKIVALSTLSQLGLMFVSFTLGSWSICLFHLLMHALAKANLFMLVGSMIHFHFSQQDARFISCGLHSFLLNLVSFISLVSLSGVTFLSGFYSKETILLSHYSALGSVIWAILLFSVVGLTFLYCSKLMLTLLHFSWGVFLSLKESWFCVFPMLVLSSFSVVFGYFYFYNFYLKSIFTLSLSGFYWFFLLWVLMIPSGLSLFSILFSNLGFFVSLISIKNMNTMKKASLKMTSVLVEGVYLISTWGSYKLMIFTSRSFALVSLICFVLWSI